MSRNSCQSELNLIGKLLEHREGYTLIELMVSLSLSAILMIGLSSALTVGLRSAQPNSSVDGDLKLAKIADKILGELALASTFSNTFENEVEFSMPRGIGGYGMDTIRYQWSDDNTFRLMRSVNNGPLVIVDSDIKRFSLDYLYRPTTVPESPILETAEVLLIEHNSTVGGSMNSFSTSLSRHCAQWFKPNFHPNAISWKITRAEIVMRKTLDSLAVVRIGIHAANEVSTWPQGPARVSMIRLVSNLPSEFEWVSFDLPDLPSLLPETGVCLVVQPIVAGFHPRVQFETASQPTSARSHWLTSLDSGSTWSAPDTVNNMRFRVYGTITVQAW